MRFSIPSIFSGTLGAIVQQITGGANALLAVVAGCSPVRTNAGQAFMGAAYLVPTVGQYVGMQLRNPAGSGVTVILNALSFNCDTGGVNVDVISAGVAFATAGQVGVNKLLGGAAPKALIRTEDTAAPISAAVALWRTRCLSGDTKYVPLVDPIVLAEGAGVVVQCASVSAGLSVSFGWNEV